MEYEGQICRSPMERASFMLPVAVGCSHNACTFCLLFKHLHYRVLPQEQVFAEIDRVAAVGGNPERVFLGDGNAFSLPAKELKEILQKLRISFPGCRSVAMDATAKNILEKSDEELKELQALRLTDLYLGIECALEDVLAFVNKGNTLAEAELAIRRLQRAGIGYDAHIMTGICGHGRGEENAEALADFFLRTQPLRICNFSLFLHRRTPLYREVEAGRFIPADELENLKEELALLERLDGLNTVYDGMHDFIPFRVRGKLPADREVMMDKLRAEIARLEETPSLIPLGIIE